MPENRGTAMLAEELATLAGTSAVTLVAAMTTDAWGSIRSGVARLFGQGGETRRREAEIQLDSNAQLVARAGDKDRARQNLVGLWRLELEELLGQYPDVADDLRSLMDGARTALPQAQQSWVMTVIAHGGVGVGVQGGNVIMHGTDWPSAGPPAGSAASEHEGQQ
jgi:hypothetical protein